MDVGQLFWIFVLLTSNILSLLNCTLRKKERKKIKALMWASFA